jgi:hypothetical protein
VMLRILGNFKWGPKAGDPKNTFPIYEKLKLTFNWF